MKLANTKLFFKNTLKFTWRDKQGIFIVAIFPLLMIAFYAFTLTSSTGFIKTYPIAVINYDTGTDISNFNVQFTNGTIVNMSQSLMEEYSNQTNANLSGQYLEVLSHLRYEKEDKQIFDIKQYYDLNNITSKINDTVTQLVKDGELTAVVFIGDGFTSSIIESSLYLEGFVIPVTRTESQIVVKGDSASADYAMTVSTISMVTKDYIISAREGSGKISVMESKIITQEVTDFDIYGPAIILLVVLMFVPNIGALVLMDVEIGIFDRLKITKLKASEYLTGITLAQLFFALFVVPLILLITMVIEKMTVGHYFPGIEEHMLMAIISATLISFALMFPALGMGLGAAAFFNKPVHAYNFSSGIAIFVAMLGGLLYPLEINIMPFTVLGRDLNLLSFLPPTVAGQAINRVLIYGANFVDVWFELVWLMSTGIVYFIVGIWLYKRNHLQN
ncbi:MAG: ABC transporter permease [Candidatus Kariarchaeaceae archaeon]|jgi:ABC-2 type transport system permease protein